MAGDWIKIEHSLPGKPEVMELARIMGIDELAVVGHLVIFWSWVDQNMSPECPSVTGTKRGLDRVACRDGFVDAMVNVGWLMFDGHDVTVPNYHHHLSESAKKRAVESRKKQQQRKLSRKCPDTNGTNAGQKQGLEKRREEINNRGADERKPEHIIPSKLDDAECHAAAEKWFAFLASKGLEDKSPAGNEIALEEWWRQMSRLGRDEFLEAVSESIAAGRWNVTKSRGLADRSKSSTRQSEEWIQARKGVSLYPDNWEQRREFLGADVFEALKRTGTAKVKAANDFELQSLGAIFESHLKDIRQKVGAA